MAKFSIFFCSMKSKQFLSVYSILFFITIFVALLTYIIPAGKFDYKTQNSGQIIKAQDVNIYDGEEKLLPIPNTYTQIEQSPQDFFEILKAPILGFHSAVDIALFILIIGGFLNVVLKTGALDAGIAKLVFVFKGNEKFLIPILMFIFALGGSSFGLAEETVAFWAILIPVMNYAGFDRMVTAGVLLLGSGVGVLSSTVNPFATGIASGFAGVQIGDGIVLRLIMFFILLSFAIFYVMRYAIKIKKSPEKSVLYDIKFNDSFGQKTNTNESFDLRKSLVLFLFFLSFLIMIFAVIPFDKMNIHFVPTLGWWFDELSTLFFSFSILIALVNKTSESDYIKQFLDGARDLIGVALVIAVARSIYIVMNNGHIIDTILNFAQDLASGLSSGVFIFVTYLLHIFLSFFIPSTSGLATVSMPLMGPLGDFAGVSRSLIITSYQSASGFINLFSPTAGHLVAGLALAKIPYTRYLKWVFPFLIGVFLLTSILLFLASFFVEI